MINSKHVPHIIYSLKKCDYGVQICIVIAELKDADEKIKRSSIHTPILQFLKPSLERVWGGPT